MRQRKIGMAKAKVMTEVVAETAEAPKQKTYAEGFANSHKLPLLSADDCAELMRILAQAGVKCDIKRFSGMLRIYGQLNIVGEIGKD